VAASMGLMKLTYSISKTPKLLDFLRDLLQVRGTLLPALHNHALATPSRARRFALR